MSCLVVSTITDPLTEASLEAILGDLRHALKGRVDQAFLFGSAATGRYSPTSDIDLILVKDSPLPFTQRGVEFLDLFDIFPRLDILVYTRQELDVQLQSADVGFWRRVSGELRRLV